MENAITSFRFTAAILLLIMVACSPAVEGVAEGTEDASLARFAGVNTGVVVVANALSCGLGGRALAQLNALDESVPVKPVLLTIWPDTGREVADRMFAMPARVVPPATYRDGVEDVFQDMPMPFIAVYRNGRLASVFGNMNIDAVMESLVAQLRSVGAVQQDPLFD